MKKALKIISFIVVFLLIVLAGGYVYLKTAFPKVGPAPDMVIEITPERLERGEYLAYHVMMCMDCHAERDWSIFSGPPMPGTLGAGGDRFDQAVGAPGAFYSSNITPAGIGDWTDGEVYRLITTGVRKDGSVIFPIMPYHNFGKMDPEDIKSVITYIRTLAPIETDWPESQFDFPFNLILPTLAREADPQPMPPPSDQLAYGAYMVNASACFDCHTSFDKGKYVGEPYAGGREFQFPDGSLLRSPNLTPHETGLKYWTKEMFVQRFKMFEDSAYVPQRVNPGEFQTAMPWAMYAGMTPQDLEAIFVYLQTLDPVDNPVERFVPAQ